MPFFTCSKTNTPNLTGKVAIVTGGTSGIGASVVEQLAVLGAKVYVPCRNVNKGEAVIDQIKKAHPDKSISIILMPATLDDLSSVRSFAQAFLDTKEPLHILVNNAGLIADRYKETKDGLEEMFGVNHVAHFLLTLLLLPALKKSTPSRIVNVASDAHKFSVPFDADGLTKPQPISSYKASFQYYGRSKLCNILFTNELARRLTSSGITSYSMHPGAVRTNIGLDQANMLFKVVLYPLRLFFRTPEKGAETVVYLAAYPEAEAHNGKYLVDLKVRDTTPDAKSEKNGQDLWEVSLKIIQDKLQLKLTE